MRGGYRLRFLEWKFRKFHKHAFYESRHAKRIVTGGETWVRLECAHCNARTWDLLEKPNP